MVNLKRQSEFFDPIDNKEEIHIIGVGAVGSHIAQNLARLGIKRIHIWDFDEVEDHNIPNQMFRQTNIGTLKVDAIENYLKEINEEIEVIKHEKYIDEQINGIIFSCVDSIETRRIIYTNNEFNTDLKAVFDTRIGLDDGQIFSADWSKGSNITNLISVSEFTHDEAETKVSSCGSKLTVLPTVQTAATLATSNFINFIKTKTLKNNIIFNAFDLTIKAY